MEETNNKTWCVYMHTNKINDKKYIGITGRSPEERWGLNGRGYYNKQPAFETAIKKYTWDGFTHKVIADGLTEAEAIEMEVYLIALYKTNCCRYTNPQMGYNMTDGGEGTSGHKHTDEAKKKIGDASKQHWQNEEYRTNQIERLIGEGNPFYGKSHTEEAKEKQRIASTGKEITEETRAKISESLKGICRSEETKKKMSEAQKQICQNEEVRLQRSIRAKQYYSNPKNHPNYGKSRSEKTKMKLVIASGTPVLQFNENGEFVAEFPSINFAAKNTGIPQSNISKCCLKKARTAGGFIWVYKKDYNPEVDIFQQIKKYIVKPNLRHRKLPMVPVIQLDINNNYIQEYKSIAEAEKQTKIVHICGCCQGKRKSAGGFKWMYKEEYDKLTQQNDLITEEEGDEI